MNNYEKLLAEYPDLHIIENYPFDESSRFKGLYADGVIALSGKLINSAELSCILAEEIGHHNTSYGNILNIKNCDSSKQEHFARAWAYHKMITFEGLIEAFNYGCRNIYEFAEYLNVTESFLVEALVYFKQKYGYSKKVGEYTFIFQPTFDIIKDLNENY